MPSQIKYQFKDNVRCIKNKNVVRRLPECGVFKREDTDDNFEPDVPPHKHKFNQIQRNFPIRRSILAPDKPDINIPQFPSSNDNNYIQHNFNPYDDIHFKHDTMFRGVPYRYKNKPIMFMDKGIPFVYEDYEVYGLDNTEFEEIETGLNIPDEPPVIRQLQENPNPYDSTNEFGGQSESEKILNDERTQKIMTSGNNFERGFHPVTPLKPVKAHSKMPMKENPLLSPIQNQPTVSKKVVVETPRMLDNFISDDITKKIIDEILLTTRNNKSGYANLDKTEKKQLIELFENIGLNKAQIGILLENNVKLTLEQKKKLILRLSEQYDISPSDIESVINDYNFFDSEFETTLSNLPKKQQALTRQIAINIRDLVNFPQPAFETQQNNVEITEDTALLDRTGTGFESRKLTALQKYFKKFAVSDTLLDKKNVLLNAMKNYQKLPSTDPDQFGQGVDLAEHEFKKTTTHLDLQSERIPNIADIPLRQPSVPEFDSTEIPDFNKKITKYFDMSEIQNASQNAFQEEALGSGSGLIPLESDRPPAKTGGKMTYKQRISSGFINSARELNLPKNRPRIAGGAFGITTGFVLGNLMHNNNLPGPVNNFIIGGSADATARIASLATEGFMNRAAFNLSEDGFRILQGFGRGALEGGGMGVLFGGADYLINTAMLNTGATHLQANVVSSNVMGASGFGLALAAAPETGGLSIPFSLLVWGVGDIVSAVSGKMEDDDEKAKRILINNSNIARTRLINTLPKYNYRLDDALNAFPDKDELDMKNDNWISFMHNMEQVFTAGDARLNNIGVYGEDETEESLTKVFNQQMDSRKNIFKRQLANLQAKNASPELQDELLIQEYEAQDLIKANYDKNIDRVNNVTTHIRQGFRQTHTSRSLYEKYQKDIINAGKEADKDSNKMSNLKETYKNIDADYEYNRTHINDLNEQFTKNTKINQLFARYVQIKVIDKLCFSEQGCGDLKNKKPPALTAEETQYLNKETKNTWMSMAETQASISYQQSRFQINNIRVAREYVFEQWSKNKKLPDDLRKQNLVDIAFADKEFKHSFNKAIMLDSQRIIINKFQNEQLKYNNLPPSIVNSAFQDEGFKSKINQYYDAMNSMSDTLNISIPQIVQLQKITDPKEQINAYQNIQFDSLKQNQEVVDSAQKLSEQEDYVREFHYYDLDEAMLKEDPISIHSWKPKDSQILQAHQTGMNLNQYVQYMHQLALGDEGSFDNITKYTQKELTETGQKDFNQFQRELVLAYRNPNMYKYDPETRQITLNDNPEPFNRDDYMKSFVPRRRLINNHIHGQSRDIQHQIDEYNSNLLEYLESKGENYEQMAWDYNEEVFRAGSTKTMATSLEVLYNRERIAINNNNNDNNNNNNNQMRNDEFKDNNPNLGDVTFTNEQLDSIDEGQVVTAEDGGDYSNM